MQKCQDSYYTTFSSYMQIQDYHEEQAKQSKWQRCQVNSDGRAVSKNSPLYGNLSAFASGTSEDAVEDTAENLGLAPSA